jgi:sentrin-specific protease 1
MEMLNTRSRAACADGFTGPARSRRHCWFMNTFFCVKLHDGDARQYKYKSVNRWSKKAKVVLTELDAMYIPVHVGLNHWCLAEIDFKAKKFRYYDSLRGGDKGVLKLLRRYVCDEAKQYSGIDDYDLSGWADEIVTELPRQHNGCDCGVFTSKYAECLGDGVPLRFEQSNMPLFRRRMALEIAGNKLLT